MRSILLALTVVASLPLTARAVDLYTFVGPCDLVLISTDDETSRNLGSLEWSVEAMDYSPDGVLYATVENGCFTHGNADTLATIDPQTLTVTPIGPIDASASGIGDVDALAFSPDGQLFAVSIRTNELITIDPLIGAGTVVGPLDGLPGSFLGAIEFLSDGTLVGIDMEGWWGGPSNFWTIDSSSGAVTFVGPVGFDAIEGMSLAPNGQVFALANSMDGDTEAILVAVDPRTGAGSFVQLMGLGGARDALAAIPAIEVTIDIKPGDKRNVINPRSKGGIWVAILSDTNPDSPFDPSSQVDVPTVEFGPDGAKAIHHKVKDINKDGLGDLLLRFNIAETGLACGDTVATLTGETFDGMSFTGSDSIKTVGCKPKMCHEKKHHHEKHYGKHHDDDCDDDEKHRGKQKEKERHDDDHKKR